MAARKQLAKIPGKDLSKDGKTGLQYIRFRLLLDRAEVKKE